MSLRIGIGLLEQRQEEVPCEEHDELLDGAARPQELVTRAGAHFLHCFGSPSSVTAYATLDIHWQRCDHDSRRPPWSALGLGGRLGVCEDDWGDDDWVGR